MPYLAIGTLVAFAIASALLYGYAQGKLKERRFDDKRLLSSQELAKLFATDRLSDSEVLDVLDFISSASSVRKGLLRPEHSFRDDLAPARGLAFDDLSSQLDTLVMQRFGSAGSVQRFTSATTVGELLRCVANTRSGNPASS